MFKKILIANRGEIACRIIKTAKKLGIKTVAVYSDADLNSLHVQMADEAINIGPALVSASYLSIEKIIWAAQETGAEAIHPGYGFLSENPKFPRALEKVGIIFIGPPVKAIKSMGDKITSKELAKKAGVSIVPGHIGLIKDVEEAVQVSKKIGYPVMIKASAGGGGKGMRVAWNDKEVEEGFYASKNEASNSFGDDRLFIEKYIVDPRHIEIQILGDCHNNLLHLGERECSIQRRNQKVIEEAPSTFIDEETRNKMGEQACKLAKAVGYTSAGTVEFIVDKDKNFYFLEMNTRLQVEHPVTELITGIDLVEEMIKIAQGKRLSFVQDDIKLNGWAIESRLYAEDPYRNFLPSIGRLTRYRPPNELTLSELVIRNDTGVTEGGEISIFYDPMIAKLCTWANSRPEAIKLMRDALDDFEIEGVGNNLPFLSAVMGHARFISGDITTAFIEDEYQGGFVGVTLEEDELRLVSSAIVSIHIFNEVRKSNISGRVNDILEVVGGDWQVSVQGVENPVKVIKNKNEVLVQYADLETQRVNFKWLPGDILVKFIINEENYSLKVNNIIGGYRVRFRGADLKVQVKTSRQVQMSLLMLEKKDMDTSKSLLCPMPGLVTSIDVMEGDEFEQGQTLCTIEAMKMENTLKAEKRGVVKTILAQVNQSISVDQLIMEFE